MIKFDGENFFVLGHYLALIPVAPSLRGVINDSEKVNLLNVLNEILSLCNRAGFSSPAMLIEDIKETLSGSQCTYETFQELVRDLRRRIEHELKSHLLMQIPKSKAEYYEKSNLFGDEVTQKFPLAITDIAEAGRCFATKRYTASVFHLMRVMELAVQYFGKKLKVKLAEEKNWQNILDEVNKAIKNLKSKTARQKAVRDKYSAASAHLQSVKEAWRNRVMHPKETYTEEEAEIIFNHVKAFIRHLATKL